MRIAKSWTPPGRSVPVVVRVAAAVALTLTGAGCGGSGTSVAGDSTPAPSASAPAAVEIRDPWVKAADSGMTAAFGTLVNNTGSDVTVVSATSALSPMELHEMTMKDGKMVMQPKTGGFLIKAGGTHALEPSGDHLMLMNLARPVKPGDQITFTLTFADGGTVEFDALAKPFAGAQESYDPSTGMSPGPGMHMNPDTSPSPGVSMSPAA